MKAPVVVGVLTLLLLAAAPPGPGTRAAPGPGLKLAVLPCSNIETTFRKFRPLLAYLESATGRDVSLVVPSDLAQLEADAAYGRIDFALQDPHTYQQVSHLFEASDLLQVLALDGSLQQSGVVIVRRDSGITDLAQLRGKTVMFGPRTSSPKWVAARMLFESKAISVERDLKVMNGGCCEDIAFEVAVRSVDAGVVCDHFLGQHGARQKELGVDASALSTIGRTRPFPTRILAARKGLPVDVVDAVARALLAVEPTQPGQAAMLASAEMRGFVRTTQADYLGALSGPFAGPP